MAGVQFQLDTTDLTRLSQRLARWGSHPRLQGLYGAIGAEVEAQTRTRIQDEKAAPDGTPWAPWSPGYAATRHGGHSLLMNEGDLLDDINFVVESGGVSVGTNLVYGAIHQFGGDAVGKAIPARPYLGLSSDNIRDLHDTIEDWLDSTLGKF